MRVELITTYANVSKIVRETSLSLIPGIPEMGPYQVSDAFPLWDLQDDADLCRVHVGEAHDPSE